MNSPSKTLDVITAGEAMIRLSVPSGTLLAESPAFNVATAGAESNVAVAVSRMGYKTRWLSRLTDNVMGRRIVHELSSYGVDCSNVAWTNEDRIGTYYLEFGASPRPTQVIYDRANSAASKMTPQTFDLRQIKESRILHLTGITPALSAGCYDLISAMIAQGRADGLHIVFDVNYRALLWNGPTCAEKLTPLLKQVDTVLISRRDAEIVFALKGENEAVLKGLQQKFGVGQVAMTVSEAGAVGLDKNGVYSAPGFAVQMVDRIGAGDAFASGVICGLLEGNFEQGIRTGVAMSALQLTLAGDLFRLGRADVNRLMQSGAASLIR